MDELLQLKIIAIIPETPDASSFVLECPGQQKATYKAGQFLTFIFNFNGREIRRSYSLSSAPGIDQHLSITVKRVINGEVSRWLLEQARPGHTLTALAPKGMFVLEHEAQKNRDIIMLAAGSGIVPVYSILKWALKNEPWSPIILVYQNHSEKSTLFRSDLARLQEQYADRFRWIDFISTPLMEGTPPQRLNNEILENLLMENISFQFSDVRIFVCGPMSFMRMCQFTVFLMGFDESQFRKEYFVIPTLPAPPMMKDPGPKRVLIRQGNQLHHVTVIYPKTILQSALDLGIALPYSCKTGRCGACAATCTNGKLEMSDNEVLTDKDLEQGLVLTCVAHPATDVEISLPD